MRIRPLLPQFNHDLHKLNQLTANKNYLHKSLLKHAIWTSFSHDSQGVVWPNLTHHNYPHSKALVPGSLQTDLSGRSLSGVSQIGLAADSVTHLYLFTRLLDQNPLHILPNGPTDISSNICTPFQTHRGCGFLRMMHRTTHSYSIPRHGMQKSSAPSTPCELKTRTHAPLHPARATFDVTVVRSD